jgi:hypothetical protein
VVEQGSRSRRPLESAETPVQSLGGGGIALGRNQGGRAARLGLQQLGWPCGTGGAGSPDEPRWRLDLALVRDDETPSVPAEDLVGELVRLDDEHRCRGGGRAQPLRLLGDRGRHRARAAYTAASETRTTGSASDRTARLFAKEAAKVATTASARLDTVTVRVMSARLDGASCVGHVAETLTS